MSIVAPPTLLLLLWNKHYLVRRVVLGWERHVSVIICQRVVVLSPNCLTKNVIIAAMSIIGMRKTKLTSYLILHNCSILGTSIRSLKTLLSIEFLYNLNTSRIILLSISPSFLWISTEKYMFYEKHILCRCSLGRAMMSSEIDIFPIVSSFSNKMSFGNTQSSY